MSQNSGPSSPKRPRNQQNSQSHSKDLDKYIRQISGNNEHNGKFQMSRYYSKFVIENVPADPEDLLRQLFESCIDDALTESRQNGLDPDRLGVTISSQLLNPDINIPIRDLTANTVDSILNRFLLVAQSKTNEGSLWGEPFTLTITTVNRKGLPNRRTLEGSGQTSHRLKPVQHKINSRSLLKVQNRDNYCLFYALELTRKHNMKEMSQQTFSYYLHHRLEQQKHDVLDLMEATNIPLALPKYDASKYAPIIIDYWNDRYAHLGHRFKVFIFHPTGHFKPVFKYGDEMFTTPIALYYNNEHFDGIRHQIGAALFGRSYYCFACETPFKDRINHKKQCRLHCLNCGGFGIGFPCIPIPASQFHKYCTNCGKTFNNIHCYRSHLTSNYCSQSRKCAECGQIWSVRDNTRQGRMGHICGERYCHTCKQFHNPKRGCFMQSLKLRPLKPYILVVFDYESTQNRQVAQNLRLHEVNFVAASAICSDCINKGKENGSICAREPTCDLCGNKRMVTFSHRPYQNTQTCAQYHSRNPIKSFIRWLFNLSKDRPIVTFSHFGGRYDIILTFREIFMEGKTPSMIRKGNKMYEMRIPRSTKNCEIIFRDSFNLMPVALGSLVAAFGLKVSPKEWFPHLANDPKNYGKILPCLPPKSDYLYGGMMPEKQRKFDLWFSEHMEEPFDLCEKLAEYCTNDVNILTEALLAFRKEFLQITLPKQTNQEADNDEHIDNIRRGIDIIWESMTIASACMKHFRLNHLQDAHLAIVPEQGYDTADNQSTLALKFLNWYGETHGVEVQTAHSQAGEYKVFGKHKVDGFIQHLGLALEIQGCCWHGCPQHYPDPNMMLPNGKTAGKVRDEDTKRLEEISKGVEKLDIYWECEIKKTLKTDSQMKESFDRYKDKGPIKLRDCFFGGRTQPFRLRYEARPGYKISYLDFISLYPKTTATTSYPVGHPRRHVNVGRDCLVDWTHSDQIPIKGILKIFLIPPQNVVVPIMPVRFEDDSRLLFTLCRSCSIQFPEGAVIPDYQCLHSDEERGWVSTCTSIELAEALRGGYRVTEYYRGLEYEKWDDQLFRGYVSEFMSMKIHASGFPDEIKTTEQENEFIKEYDRRFGIKLEREKMCPNKAKRYISKLANNNLWGRFSLRNQLSKTHITDSPAELRKYLDDKQIEVNSIDELTDETVLITYTPKDEFVEEHSCSNIVLSLWTTSAARILLLKALQKVAQTPDCSLLYCDTDSIIFSHPERQEPPLLPGPYLGDLSIEYPEYNIKEFLSSGCKAYSLRLEHKISGEEKTILRVRGITLSGDICQKLHFESFKKSILLFGSSALDEAERNCIEEEEQSGKAKQDILLEYPNFIRPNIKTGTVHSTILKKFYRPIVPKAIVGKNLILRDFGSKE